MDESWYAQRFLAELMCICSWMGQATGWSLLRTSSKNRAGQWRLKNGRERFLLLLADTIQSPDEIWQTEEKLERGRARVRRRYVARWLLPGEEVPALTVFEWGRDIWQPITAFQPDDVGYLERRDRLCTRLWVRPNA
ncbi:MAG: PBECR2 nuclease fold domain-containing protein [Tepidimonas taiwanensis]|nr:PBECR2 nuclease fold domain-containing protein [Tepidimonas taiwanensis]